MLGWDTVRNLVSTVRYIEHYTRRAPGLRELMLLSVLSAVHSRQIATTIGYPSPEEAYICGLFRNLGEVLVGCHLPHEYSSIILAMHTEKIPHGAACMRVLDFTWDEVGVEVGAAWNMPDRLRHCLRGAAASGGSNEDGCLASIADYAHDLTHALYRQDCGIDQLHLRPLLDPEGHKVLVSVRDLYRIVDSTLRETQRMFQALDISAGGLRLEQQAERARFLLESVPVFDVAALRELDQTVEAGLRTVRHGEFELTELIAGLLEAVTAAGFDRAVFGLVNEEHTHMRGRLASGEAADDLLEQFHFRMDRSGGVFLPSLQRHDLLVDRSRDARYDDSPLVGRLEPSAFALFPIVVDHETAGCIYADRQGAAPGLDNLRSSLGRMRDLIATAIRKKAPNFGAAGGSHAGSEKSSENGRHADSSPTRVA